MAIHNELGKKGEKIAVDYFKSEGCDILHQNYRHGRGEIDIVVRNRDGQLRFVEVKTRMKNETPESSVDAKKIQLLIDTGIHYKYEHSIEEESFLDIIAINFTNDMDYEMTYFNDVWF